MKVTLKNFRKYQYASDFEFRRFTIFTGRNSTGKSTILKAISVIGDSFGHEDGNLKLNLSGRNVKSHGIYSAENVFNWDSKKKEFEVSISDGNIFLEINYSELFDNSVFISGLTLKSNVSGKTLIHLKCTKEGNSYQYKLRCVEALASVDMGTRLMLDVLVNGHETVKSAKRIRKEVEEFDSAVHESKLGKIVWEGEQIEPITSLNELERIFFTAWMTKNMDDPKKGKKSSDGEQRRLELLKLFRPIRIVGEIFKRLSNVKHLSSKRAVAPRLIMRADESYDIYKEKSTKRLSKEARDFVLKWIKKFAIGDYFNIDLVEGVAIKVEILHRGKTINLADKGMGEAQLWRIIFTLGIAIDESGISPVHLLIEEPDSNLHPAYQSKLVEPILDSLQRSRHLKISVETHSEYLIRSLMVRTKKKPEIREDILINYVDGKRRANCKVIEIQEDGRLSTSFGPGFFDEASNLSMELF